MFRFAEMIRWSKKTSVVAELSIKMVQFFAFTNNGLYFNLLLTPNYTQGISQEPTQQPILKLSKGPHHSSSG
jgi:hypothetical protein